MSEVPSNLIPTRITQLPYAPVASEESLLLIVYQGNTYQIMAGDLLQVAGVPTSRQVIAGTGMTGGGQLTGNVTLSIAPGGVGSTQLANSGVTAGNYGSATEIPVFSVDDKGRVTAATTIPVTVSGYVPTSREVIAGEGLNGGGPLNANVTLNVDLASATPLPGNQSGSAGSSTDVARADHEHPAVDLSDADEVDGILGLSNGGTAKSLVANAGAIIWSGADGLYVGPAGVAGQILQSNGTSQYVWVDQSGLDVGQADNLNGGAANRIPVQTAPDTTGFITAPSVTDTFLKWNGSNLVWDAVAGAGTVTSVNASGGTTGMTFSGGPITASGTLTLSGTLIPANGGTGISSYAVGDLLFANTTTSLDKLTVGSNGYLLASNGTAPAYVNPTSVTIGTATNLAGGAGGSIPYQSIAGTTTFLASGTGVLTASGGNPSYTMSPSLTQVTVAGDPTTNLQVATKQYVDTLVSSGITYHTPVKYEVPDTTGNLNATYNNGTAGVGATLTNAGTLGAFTPDGTVAQVGDRILIYNQTNAYENGVYTVTTVGSGSVAWVLTRSTDTDSYALKDPNGLGEGDAFFITSGATGAGETYVCNTSGTITFGTTAITFVQVSATQVYSAGTGLTLTGTTFSLTAPVATSLGGTGLSSFTSGGAVYATSTSALTTGTLPVTAGGTGATSLTSGYLVKGNGTSAASASVVYDDGTNVGIGTTSPAQKLHVATTAAPTGTTQSFLRLTGDATYGADFGGGLIQGTGPIATISTVSAGTATERMRIDSSGNVGIGTSSPTAGFKLDVNGTALASAYSFGRTNQHLIYDAASTEIGFRIGTSGPYYGIGTTGSNTMRINSASGGDMLFAISSTERMRINSSGNVGIGTSSPGSPLDVQKVQNAATVIQVANTDAGASASARLVATNGTATGGVIMRGTGTTEANYLVIYNSSTTAPVSVYTNGSERMRITSAGYVGIGTGAPAGTLDVTGSSGSVVVNAAGDQIAYTFNGFNYLTASGATATLQIQASGASGKLTFATAGSERMRITAAGNVGIGTSSPSGALDVVRSAADSVINVTSGSNTLQIFENTAGDAYLTNYASGKSIRFSQSGAGFINFGVNGSERMRIDSAGNVGIGTVPSGAKLDVSGLIRSRTSTAYVDFNHDGVNGALNSTSSLLMYAGGANPMILHTNGSERMRITSAGNVGIGTSSPTTKLDVSGTVKATAFTGIDGGTF